MGNSCSSSMVMSPHGSDFNFNFSEGFTPDDVQKFSWMDERFSPRFNKADKPYPNSKEIDSKQNFWIRPNVNERHLPMDKIQEYFEDDDDDAEDEDEFAEPKYSSFLEQLENKENYVQGRPLSNEFDDAMSMKSAGTLKLESPISKRSTLSSAGFNRSFIEHVRSSSRELSNKKKKNKESENLNENLEEIQPENPNHSRYQSMGPIHFETLTNSRDFGRELSEYSFDSVSSLIGRVQKEVALESLEANTREDMLFRDRTRANFNLMSSGFAQSDSRRTTSVTSSSTGMSNSEYIYGYDDRSSRTFTDTSSVTGISYNSAMGDETSSISDGTIFYAHDVSQSISSVVSTSQEFSSQEIDLDEIDDFLKVFTNRNKDTNILSHRESNLIINKNHPHVRKDSPCVQPKPSPLLNGTLKKNNLNNQTTKTNYLKLKSPSLNLKPFSYSPRSSSNNNEFRKIARKDTPSIQPSAACSSFSQRLLKTKPLIPTTTTTTCASGNGIKEKNIMTTATHHVRNDSPCVEQQASNLLKKSLGNSYTGNLYISSDSNPVTPVEAHNASHFAHMRQDTPNLKRSSVSRLIITPETPGRVLDCPSCEREYESESEEDYSRQVYQNTPSLDRRFSHSASNQSSQKNVGSRSHTPGVLYATPELESVTPRELQLCDLSNISKSQRSSTTKSIVSDRTSKSCGPLLDPHSVQTSEAPYSEGYRKYTSGKEASDTDCSQNTNLFERFCYDDSIGEEEDEMDAASIHFENNSTFDIVYSGYVCQGICSFQKRKRSLEVRKYKENHDLQLVLHATELTMVVNLQHMLQTVIDECYVLLCFDENEINLEFNNADEANKFINLLPEDKTMHVVFSSEAVLFPDMFKVDLRLVKQGSGKRLCDAQNIPTLVLTVLENDQTISIPITRDTLCSVQARFVALNEHVDPKILEFPHFSVANHFAHVFSVLKHDLFQADYVVIFSGLVKHQTISKKIEIRQYDSGTTKLLIFKNKETYFIFPQLPSFHIVNKTKLELEVEVDNFMEEMNLEFRSEEELKYFTHFMNPVVE